MQWFVSTEDLRVFLRSLKFICTSIWSGDNAIITLHHEHQLLIVDLPQYAKYYPDFGCIQVLLVNWRKWSLHEFGERSTLAMCTVITFQNMREVSVKSTQILTSHYSHSTEYLPTVSESNMTEWKNCNKKTHTEKLHIPMSCHQAYNSMS